jgi:hypothetical protein
MVMVTLLGPMSSGPNLADRAQSNSLKDPEQRFPGLVISHTNTTQINSSTSSNLFHKMSNEDKARAAAAQLVIDDEPDDWYVKLWSMRRSGEAKMEEANWKLTRKLGISVSSAQAAQVRLQRPFGLSRSKKMN